MVTDRNEEENKKFLKWLGFVYPRFKEFYDNLETKNASHDFGKGDQVPAEMFCVVNKPTIVSPANLILSGVE